MGRSVLCVLILATAVIASFDFAIAAVPSVITAQGKLTDNAGQPLTPGAKSFTFRIYDAASVGSKVWPAGAGEVQSVTTTTEGLWTALVGGMEPLTENVFADTVRWLEIEVEGTILPRVRLVTGPFAFRVATVDGASGGTITSKVAIGPGHTNTGTDAFVAGEGNTVTGDYSTVGGGQENVASGTFATVGGGRSNLASPPYSTIAGGDRNIASGQYSFVGGGLQDSALGDRSAVGGGQWNVTTGAWSTVGGGGANYAMHEFATVAGGNRSIASGPGSTVGGGEFNRARGSHSTIAGGGSGTESDSNSATGANSAIGGGNRNSAIGEGAVIGGGYGNTAMGNHSVVTGGYLSHAGGLGAVVSGIYDSANGYRSTVSGGELNRADANYAAVGGGSGNHASGEWATVGGGFQDTASGSRGTVSGGQWNVASNAWSTVGGGGANYATGQFALVTGGNRNIASGLGASVGGGEFNRARGSHSTIAGGGSATDSDSNQAGGSSAAIGGGRRNLASGEAATIPGGQANSAGGKYSFAAGRRAKATHPGAFVWADSTDADFTSTALNQFIVRASGGVGIGTTAPEGPLHVYEGSAGVVTSNADAAAVFERNGAAWLQILTPDASQRGILFGSPANSQMGSIRFNPPGNLKGFDFRGGSNALRLILDSLGNLTAGACVIGSNIACPSDARFKKNVETIDHALDLIERLRGVRYEWKTELFPDRNFAKGEQIGLIAQEARELVPQAVIEQSDGYLAVDYARLVPLLIEGIKEQQRRIEALEEKLDRQTP